MPNQKPEEREMGSGDMPEKQGLWERLKDRDRWPRKLWYPPMEEMPLDALNEAYKDCAQTVRRSMLTLLGLCLFTIVTVVGTPDSSLVLGDAKINIPFANADMVVGGFMFAITLILIIVLTYLQVFLGHLKRLGRAKGIRNAIQYPNGPTISVSMLFTLDGKIPRAMSYLTFYWSVPLTLAVVVAKGGLPFPNINVVGIVVVAVVTVVTIFLASIRDRSTGRAIRNRCHWAVIVGALVITVHALLDPAYYHRPLLLQRANLRGSNLHEVNLIGANLLGADLRETNLEGAILQEAYLGRANLQEANLIYANLQKTQLGGANLQGANLTGANLQGAFLGLANLQGANLLGANLQDTSFLGADLQNANLRSVKLHKTKFIGANLQGADLTDANFKDALLYGACGDKNTRLPEGYTIPPCTPP